MNTKQSNIFWHIFVFSLVIFISILHYSIPTHHWQYHLILMQSYFIPILIAAFQFGIRGGLGTAVIVSIIYFPHIMLQWGGLIDTNLMRFMQILLFNIIGYLTGLKSQKELQEKIKYQKLAKELEFNLQKLKIQSDEMVELEEQLRQNDRLSVIGELSASLAHEIRNPLTSMRGAIEIIKNEAPPQLQKSEFFQIIFDETKRLGSIVETYLSFTRSKTKDSTKFDLRDVINRAVKMLSVQTNKKNILVQIDLPDIPLLFKGDFNQMWQLLMNLIINSIQSMQRGGVIGISVVNLGLVNSENISDGTDKKIKLIVRDEGSGISKKEINKIFKPFYTTKDKGSGLGLSIVKRISDENGWKISVNSDGKSGTEFCLEIPLLNINETINL